MPRLTPLLSRALKLSGSLQKMLPTCVPAWRPAGRCSVTAVRVAFRVDPEVEAARKAVAAERLRQKEEINAHINAQNKEQRARIAQMKKDGGHTQADVSVSAVVFAAKLKSGVGGGLAAKLMASADGKAAAGGLAG